MKSDDAITVRRAETRLGRGFDELSVAGSGGPPDGETAELGGADRPLPDRLRDELAGAHEPAYEVRRASEYVDRTLFYVPTVARRYLGQGLGMDELVAAGNLGLVEAALRFDPRRDVHFTTYANWWIRKAILEALGRQSGPLRLPRHQYDKLRAAREARRRWIACHGREPDPEELAKAAGLKAEEIGGLASLVLSTVSLEQPLRAGDARPVKEVLADPRAENPHRALVRRDLAERLHRLISQLASRERQVLSLRFGLGDAPPRTLRETGRCLGLSRERVRQVELRALLKLRRQL